MKRKYKKRKEIISTNFQTCHQRAQKLVPKGKCEICGVDNARDVHHKDKDYTNNKLNNLIRVCSKCHTNIHKPWEKKVPKYKVIKCDKCGKKFYQFNGKKIFCSKSCATSKRAIKKRIVVKCKQCGKDFEKRPCEIKNGEGKFCSIICRKKYGYHRR